MKKLLIFDLDETLIHVKRDVPQDEEDDFENDDSEHNSFEPEVDIPIKD